MRKIIDGKAYDTETAREVCIWIRGYTCPGRVIYDTFEETLYQMCTGEFFIYCEGGPLFCYTDGRVRLPHDLGITPLTEAEAREWVEGVAMEAERYKAIFGDAEE